MEQLHRRLQWLAAGRLRPERLRRQVDRGLVQFYISDPSAGGHGLLVDNASLVVGGTATETEGFSPPWVPGASPEHPRAARPSCATGRAREKLFKTYGAVTTDDSVLLGFGLEHVTAAADRAALIGKALSALNS